MGEAARELHAIGRRVAEALALAPEDVGGVEAVGPRPPWASSLPVAELAFDSVALASVAMELVARERGAAAGGPVGVAGSGVAGGDVAGGERGPGGGRAIRVDMARVAASFGSERLLRIDGAAPDVWAPLSGFWRVRDGWVRTHGNYPHHAERLAALLGLSAEADRPTVEAALHGWSRCELEERAAAAGALAIAVRDPDEWQRHPQAAWLDATPVVRIGSYPGAAPRPWAGDASLPLSGIRVLDLTRVIAGPVATRDLALAGADVLRIDSPRLPEAAWQHLDTGHGKRSALLDLDDPAGGRILDGLLAGADVLVHGYRPGALARHGLDAAALRERHPGLVVAQLSAWGTGGPWGGRRGFDSLVQAASGIAVRESPEGATPGALPVQALDHSTGHFLAAAIAVALRRQRTEGGSPAIGIDLARIAAELLRAGSGGSVVGGAGDSGGADAADAGVGGSVVGGAGDGGGALPTVTVPVAGGPAVVECAPPVLAFGGAPTDYPRPLHPWGSDDPVWDGPVRS